MKLNLKKEIQKIAEEILNRTDYVNKDIVYELTLNLDRKIGPHFEKSKLIYEPFKNTDKIIEELNKLDKITSFNLTFTNMKNKGDDYNLKPGWYDTMLIFHGTDIILRYDIRVLSNWQALMVV